MEQHIDPNNEPTRHSVGALIAFIRKRPTLLIGTPTIECLAAFLSGWFYANAERAADLEVWENFLQYVANRFKVDRSVSWDRVIRFYSQNSVDAFSRFFDLFDEASQPHE